MAVLVFADYFKHPNMNKILFCLLFLFSIITGRSLGQGMIINSGADVTVIGGGKIIVSNSDLTIKSISLSPTGTGSLVLDNDAGSAVNISGTGNTAKVERYLVQDQWHFISTPISDGLAGIFLDQYLKTLVESTNDWGPYIVPPTTPLPVGIGYACWPIETNAFLFSGTLNNGTQTSTITFTDGLHGNNLVGNPFPSAIDWDASSGWTKTNIGNTIWTWNPTLGQYGTYNNPTSTNGATNIIPIGQGFVVQAIGASPALSMDNRVRVHNSTQAFLKTTLTALRLKVEGNGSSDEIVIRFMPESTSNYNSVYDARKRYGEQFAPQLYSLTQNDKEKVSINTLPELPRTLVIPVGLEVGANGTYTITASGMETFPGNVTIFMDDLKLGITQDLTAQKVYSFSSDSMDNADRFLLRFSNPSYGIDEQNYEQQVHIYSNGNTVYIRDADAHNISGNVFIYNFLGKEICHCAFENIPLVKIHLAVTTGYYCVRVITEENTTVQKVFID